MTDSFWTSTLMVMMYFTGSFVTWYIIKGIDHEREDDE
jgi:hypothetical protein